MRRIALIALAVLGCAIATPALADRAADEAMDRFSELSHAISFSRALDGGEGLRGNAAPFMINNSGSAATFLVGCESRCTSIRIRLRAAGLPDVVAEATPESPYRLQFAVPQEYVRSLSNWETDLDIGCSRSDGCEIHWALVATGGTFSTAQRGLPSRISDAEWNAGVADGARLVWTQRPTAESVRFFYPVTAWRRNAAGRATLQCIVQTSGALRCRATGESPTGSGFGDAALRIATTMRVQQTDAAGQPTANRKVTVPIQFSTGQ